MRLVEALADRLQYAGFDEELVGPKGQGYRWHAHGDDVDVLRYSIAPPPPPTPLLADDHSDEESQAATNDDAPDLQHIDPEVRSLTGLPDVNIPHQNYQPNNLKSWATFPGVSRLNPAQHRRHAGRKCQGASLYAPCFQK